MIHWCITISYVHSSMTIYTQTQGQVSKMQADNTRGIGNTLKPNGLMRVFILRQCSNSVYDNVTT